MRVGCEDAVSEGSKIGSW